MSEEIVAIAVTGRYLQHYFPEFLTLGNGDEIGNRIVGIDISGYEAGSYARGACQRHLLRVDIYGTNKVAPAVIILTSYKQRGLVRRACRPGFKPAVAVGDEGVTGAFRSS